MDKGASLRDRAVVNGAASVSAVPASVPSADRDAILLEVAGWIEEGDFIALAGIMGKRKRIREDAALRIETSKDVRRRMADMIRGRMQNKVGQPEEFIRDVKAGRYDKMYTAFDVRAAIALADKGFLKVEVVSQIAGPWNNTVGGQTAYRFSVTDKGEALLAQAIEARRAETQGGSVEDESAVAKPCAQSVTGEPS